MRPVRVAALDVSVTGGADGAVYMRTPRALGAYPDRLTDSLERWAAAAPDRAFLAERDAAGGWRRLSYANAYRRVRAVAQALLERRLSSERPVAILSGNGIDHAVLALAAMYAGVYYVPIAPAYSLQAAGELAALRRVFDVVQPALVFAADGAAYARAIDLVVHSDVELVVSTNPPYARRATTFDELMATPVTAAVDEAHRRVGPDTIAKVLFTSGSTGRPKGVLNTQRMLCSNQEMIRSVLLFLQDAPPVLCDWLPWNHTAGGNHNFGLVLYNGGTLYIDAGKPTPALFGATLRNLTEIPCTAHFTVPRFYEMLLPHLQADAALRDVFFRDLKVIFSAAAGLGQRFWDELREVSIQACGEEVLIMSGFGATETAPFMMTTGPGGAASGVLGLPAPGVELKLAPVGDKLEARVKGPNITPGYLKDQDLTAAAFDDEGFYRLGDAMQFVDASDPSQGVVFDGRLAEDFKLSTGTWVSVGPLRIRFLQQAAGLAQDVVIAAPDRDEVTALVFPNLDACRALARLQPSSSPASVLVHGDVRRAFACVLAALARQGTGSSTLITRLVLLDRPPSLDAREVTDKGSINQKAVLQHRAAQVEALYRPPFAEDVITAPVQTT